MTQTFYSADLHLGHRGILRHRPRWATVEEMDAELVANWNDTVSPTDLVWVLGDIAMSASKLGPVAQLNGVKMLVCGNHDAPWAGHSKPRQRARYLAEGFADVVPAGVEHEVHVGPHEVVLAHLPYYGDHTETERYPEWRPVDEGLPLLHGHVHEAWKTRDRMINVGVDVWDWRPVSAETIAELIQRLPAWRPGG